MAAAENLKTYYTLYCAIREIPRFTVKQISPALTAGGRGQKYSTVAGYINKLYEKKISLRPNLILRNHENCYTRAYFLKVINPKYLTEMFSELSQNRLLSYMLLLSGRYDFFVTSKCDLTFGDRLKIARKSILYDPIYTHPARWNSDVKESLKKVADLTLNKGTLKRDMEDWLPWEDIHFEIFELMKNNVHIPFSKVAARVNISQTTVKNYFYEIILPYCDIAHYFFPKGYDHYQKSFVIIRSKYEKGLIEAFSKMPCTCYIYPLEKEIILVIFHESTNDLMFTFKKLEEREYIKKHILQVPLIWD